VQDSVLIENDEGNIGLPSIGPGPSRRSEDLSGGRG